MHACYLIAQTVVKLSLAVLLRRAAIEESELQVMVQTIDGAT